MSDFLLSGDPERDARTAAAIRRTEANESEGMCPNGCGPKDPNENPWTCPLCGCVTSFTNLYVGRPA